MQGRSERMRRGRWRLSAAGGALKGPRGAVAPDVANGELQGGGQRARTTLNLATRTIWPG
ncbi:protein of unknown function [Hyphomicrobium sp. 1Nfss2.1]